ncbi:MAG TPA: tRNA lysidine(34) synthetase TilS [Candidatus Binatia bacterium]|nr:tRNA lysidine(34) synthetase TilS [Candidatus Binatia bacterium]
MPAPLSPPTLGRPPRLAAGRKFWLGFSGGLDSTVLLHLLREAGVPLRALHVNHQLQSAAPAWVEHCRAVAAQCEVPLYVMEVDVAPRHASGPEAAARQARHGAFRSLMKPGDCLITAHHQEDQAETVLLRLLRGAGVNGLAAMRPLAPFPPGIVWRPLLAVPRRALEAHAQAHGLRWLEDPHNRDPRYSRSFLRLEILPRLQERWPQASEGLARVSAHCAEAVELLDEVAAGDARAAALGEALSVRALLALQPARRHNLVRWWLAGRHIEAPPAETLHRLEREVLRARPDATPVLAWGNHELRRYRDELRALRRLPAAPGDVRLAWQGRDDLLLPPGCGILRLKRAASEPLALVVRFARGGERLKITRGGPTRELRKLFQEAGVPAWERERTPLIEHEGALAAVADRWATPDFAALRRRSGLQFRWERKDFR